MAQSPLLLAVFALNALDPYRATRRASACGTAFPRSALPPRDDYEIPGEFVIARGLKR